MNYIHSTAIIGDNVTIGDGNIIGAYTVIGSPAQVRGNDKTGMVKIGDNNIIREFVTIDASCRKSTEIGNGNFIMSHVHIAGDCKVGNNCNISTGTSMGGGCEIGDYAFLGLGSLIHQRRKIGESAMIGMGCVVIRDVTPFDKVAGVPARWVGLNLIGAERRGVNQEYIRLKRCE